VTKLLRKLLADKLLPDEMEQVAGGFDIIGDLAIVKLSESFSTNKKELIASTLLQNLKNIRAIWNQVGPVEGDFRVRKLEFLGGEGRSTTMYMEHGCRFMVDVSKMYFSPRLSTERERIRDIVHEDEDIFNMFAGVGTFSIVIAKKKKAVMIYSSEINADAYEFMVQNVQLNKVQDRVAPLLGDCAEASKKLVGGVDRVLMPLPDKAKEYLPYAIETCKPNGIIHYYAYINTSESEPAKVVWNDLEIDFPELSLVNAKVVREVGPRTFQVVLDLRRTEPSL